MNLLTETRTEIDRTKHAPSDVVFIGSRDGHSCTWTEFEQLADREYDDGFGGQEVASDLEVHFSDGSFLSRDEYDGSERWAYFAPLVLPVDRKPIRKVIVDRDADDACWSTVAELNSGATS